MSIGGCVVWWLLQGYVGEVQLVPWPTLISGYARGAAAVPLDVAAVGAHHGFELQLRQFGSDQAINEWGSLALYGLAPLGPLIPFVGMEWQSFPNPNAWQLSLGSSLKLRSSLYVGLGVRAYSPQAHGVMPLVDIGLFWTPNSWVSVSFGLDALGGPSVDTVHQPSTGRFGIAVRPIYWPAAQRARDWLTLGAEVEILTGAVAPLSLRRQRSIIDFKVWDGVHVAGAYLLENNVSSFYALLDLHFSHYLASGMGQVDKNSGSSGVLLGYQTLPPENAVRPLEVPKVQTLRLEGDLHAEPPHFWLSRERLPEMLTSLLQWSLQPQKPAEVVVHLDKLDVGLAVIEELRAAILALKQSGVVVRCIVHSCDSKTYMVAAAATQIHIDPAATDITVNGFLRRRFYLKDFLHHLGIKVDTIQIGSHKNAGHMLSESEATALEVADEAALLAHAQASLASVLQQDRHFSAAQIANTLKHASFTSSDAMAYGLVDGEYPLWEALKPPPKAVSMRPAVHTPRWGPLPYLAVVSIEGMLLGKSPAFAQHWLGPVADIEAIETELQHAAEDTAAVGILLRIDSPGGDLSSAERLWRAVRRAKQYKKVVVSIGDVAASGGYYVASAADWIVAQPSSLTGSIGIFSLKADLSELLRRWQIGMLQLGSGPLSDMDSLYSPMTKAMEEAETTRLQHLQQLFVQRVAAGRRKQAEEIMVLASGQVFRGEQAIELGLVDQLGGIVDAAKYLQTQAHLTQEPLAALPWHIMRAKKFHWLQAGQLLSANQVATKALSLPRLWALSSAGSIW